MEEKSFVSLRKDYSQFVYEKFSWNVRGKSLAISFNFSAKGGSASGGQFTIFNLQFDIWSAINQNIRMGAFAYPSPQMRVALFACNQNRRPHPAVFFIF